MKRNKIIYWISTATTAMIFAFSLYMMYTPLYPHLGFPTYFRIELVIFKILGILALLIPAIPMRIKEWTYAGMGILLISACVAHSSSGDGFLHSLEPLVWLAILIVSYVYLHRIKNGVPDAV